jgi:hypothetical protein
MKQIEETGTHGRDARAAKSEESSPENKIVMNSNTICGRDFFFKDSCELVLIRG